jgi:hypothetical protein
VNFYVVSGQHLSSVQKNCLKSGFGLAVPGRLAHVTFMNVTNLENEALNLPATEKSRLIDLLWNSLSGLSLQNDVLKLPAREKFRLMELLWDSLSEPELKARETAWAAESEQRTNSRPLKPREARLIHSDLHDGPPAERAFHFAG